MSPFALLLARIAIAVLFLRSGIYKAMDPDAFIAGLTQRGVPEPEILGWIGIAIEVVAPVLLVTGFVAGLAPHALVAFTIAATLIAHRFWDMPPDQYAAQVSQFLKNTAVAGGLLALFAAGERGTLRDLLGGRGRASP